MIPNNDKDCFCRIEMVADFDSKFICTKKDGEEIFSVHFSGNLISKFFSVSQGYLLCFSSRSQISRVMGGALLVDLKGKELWWAEKSKYCDLYSNIFVKDRDLIAYDGEFNCYLDWDSGKILKYDFVK